jgi:hypothetical protein
MERLKKRQHMVETLHSVSTHERGELIEAGSGGARRRDLPPIWWQADSRSHGGTTGCEDFAEEMAVPKQGGEVRGRALGTHPRIGQDVRLQWIGLKGQRERSACVLNL